MTKITDNSDELTFHQLTSASRCLIIPLFQRAYRWKNKQRERLLTEIDAIIAGEDASRFLGAVIAVNRPTNPSQPDPYEVVDGQQRLTTLYLLLLAAAQEAARTGHSEYSRGLLASNLIVDWAQESASNTKLQPSYDDRRQFKTIFDGVVQTGDLSDWLPARLRLPPATGEPDGPMLRQYKKLRVHLKKRQEAQGFEGLEKIVETARTNLTFVFILLKDPGSATTVFEGLNDPGIPISVGDLVKNEVFAKAGYSEDDARVLHETRWVPFRAQFGDAFDDYFFPYAVIKRSNVSRTEMFSELRNQWKDLDASGTLAALGEYQSPYLALEGHSEYLGRYDSEVRLRIRRLIEMNRPAAILPFGIKLLKELDDSNISKVDVVASLDVVSSFLVRRALCGIEPTGLLGFFRTLWSVADNMPTGERVAAAILRRLTVEWPTDERLSEAIRERPLYGSSIAKHAVLEYDRSLGMDEPGGEWSIEHVMPKTRGEHWAHVTFQQHEQLRHTWANLIPISQPMNSVAAQAPYTEKRPLFADSMFGSARKLASDFATWTPEDVAVRAAQLIEWAKARWPRPRSTPASANARPA